MHTVYFSLGANIGDRKKTLKRALTMLNTRVGLVERVSSFYETEPWGFLSANKFINVCACCLTSETPFEVLKATQAIERELGRAEKSSNGEYSDRPIDIDILLYDDLHIDTPDLKIPHPLMQERDFVMLPLREIMLPKQD